MGNQTVGPSGSASLMDQSNKIRMTVGISDMKVSNDQNAFLITHSLGPCIGLIFFDPANNVSSLLHFQLPTAKGHGARGEQNPFMFADTAIPIMLKEVLSLGGKVDRLVVSMFGGASMLQNNNVFKIGVQNTRAAKKILWQNCIALRNEDSGGKSSRTVSIDIESGKIKLQMDGKSYFY